MKESILSIIFGNKKSENTSPETDPLKIKTYEEICNFHRFFLNWRHASFAGYIVIMGFLLNTILKMKTEKDWWVVVPVLSGIILAIIFSLFDKRINEIYSELIKAG